MEKIAKAVHGAVYHNPNSFFGYCGWPSVCKDDEGTLYAVCSGFRAAHICPFGKTTMFISKDEGKTWSVPMVINDTYLDDRDAGIISLGGKKLLVTWFTHPTECYRNQYDSYIRNAWGGSGGVLDMYDTIPEGHRDGGSWVRVCEDGGMTWGETVQVPVSAPHGPILRRDGSILYFGKEMYTHDAAEPDIVSAYESRDDGKTWVKLGDVPKPEGLVWNNFHEPHVLELPDGRLLGTIRAEGREIGPHYTVFQTVSEDGGKTWSMPVSLGVSGSPPHLLQHSSGAIVLAVGRRQEPFGQRALVSRDGGETWPEEYIIKGADYNDIGYPCSVELSDGSILTVYYQHADGESYPSLLWSRWEL